MRKIVFALISVFTVNLLCAQGGEDDGGFNQTQVITGDRTLTVQKAFKISELPVPQEIEVEMGDLDYLLIPRRPDLTVEVDSIEAARVKIREPLDKLYKGYVKAGAGNFATPLLEAYFASDRDRELAYGAKVRHLSHNDGVNRPVAFSGMSQNSIDVWGKKIFGKHSLQSQLSYNRDVWHYYGFDPQDADIDNDDIQQRFNLFELNSNWKSYYRDSSKVNHDLGLDIYYLNDRFEAGEFGINATGDLRSYRGDQLYLLDLGFDLISYSGADVQAFEFMSNDSISIAATDETNAIFNAVPKIVLRNGAIRADVGLGIYARFTDKVRFNAFPDLEFSVRLFNDIFVPYAGVTGNVERVSYRTLTTDNPFVLSQLPLENTVNRYKAYGGFRGSVSDNLSFNVGASYQKGDNTPLFVNDTLVSRENRFSVIYDDVKTFTLFGEVTYTSGDKWGVNLSGRIYSYDTEDEDEAWHLPSSEFTLAGHYNLYDKFVLGASAALIGSRQVKSLFPIPNEQPEDGGYWKVELDPYLDISLSAEYRYTERLSAFIQATNLTATKYDIYYRFPAQRAFVLGGVKYSF